jgi:hypothetical protein
VMRRSIFILPMALACVLPALASCRADEAGASGPHFETYVGADYNTRIASLTTNTVWSPFAPVTQPGFRLKLDGLSDVYGTTDVSIFSKNFMASDFKTLGDLMAGYQFNSGPVWIKVYAGASYQAQTRAFWDAGQIVQQQMWGAAAAVEGFWRIDSRVWTSTNVSWLQPDQTTSLYHRTAYEFYQGGSDFRISAGAEAGLTVNNADIYKEGKALNIYDGYVRGGALFNLRYGVNDVTISGGMSQSSGDATRSPYATIRYGRQF